MTNKITGVLIDEIWKTNIRNLPYGLIAWFNVLPENKREFVLEELNKMR